MSHKVLITDSLAPQGVERLRAFAELGVDERPGLKGEDLLRAIPAYQGLIIRSGTQVTKEIIATATLPPNKALS
jgi:D-3-phosphoglycerate dehydrogenase